MKRPYQITAALCLLFTAFVVHQSIKLKFYTPMGPGPGFFPFWLALIFGLLAVMMLYHATYKVSEPMPDDFYASRSGYLRIAAIVGALLGTVVLFEWLGYRLTMLAFFLFLLTALSRQRVIVTVTIALVGSFGVYQLFSQFLEIPLPIGVFGI